MLTAADASSTSCPVALMANDAMRLIRQEARYQLHAPELANAAWDRLLRLQVAATEARATSTAGLFFQTCIAYAMVCDLDPMLKDDVDAGWRADLSAGQRAMISIASSLYDDSLSVLGEHYMPREFWLTEAA